MKEKIKYIRLCKVCKCEIKEIIIWSPTGGNGKCPTCGEVDLKNTERILVKK